MDSRETSPRKRGFSLVELSIVLVILGLLVGGVLSGQSLIRASQLRSVIAEYQKYDAAYNTYRDKYFQLPGDATNASQFWGSLGGTGSDYACQSHAPSGNATCNGNGDGMIGFPWSNCTVPGGTNVNTVVTYVSEMTRFWQHLSNAGLIEGSYSGFANAAAYWAPAYQASPPNMPLAKIGNAYWMPSGNPTGSPCGGSASMFNNTGAGPQLTLGPSIPLSVAQTGAAPIFKPEEAWNIDTKLDDSKPGTGKVTSDKTTCSTASGVAPPGDANAQYQLSTTTQVCGITIDL